VPTLLRLSELIVGLIFIAWTVVFPLATLLSLLVTLPLLALFVAPPPKAVALSRRFGHSRR
jgi:hypothetical protein